jgi:hypothetical protein
MTRDATVEDRLANITVNELLEAGVHFGHQTKRWNPKMKKFIFAARNGIHIIDLNKTLTQIQIACGFLHEVVLNGGSVLFVGTKKQAQQEIKDAAKTGCLRDHLGSVAPHQSARSQERQPPRGDRSTLNLQRADEEGSLQSPPRRRRLHRNLDGIVNMELRSAMFMMSRLPFMSPATGVPIIAPVDSVAILTKSRTRSPATTMPFAPSNHHCGVADRLQKHKANRRKYPLQLTGEA